LKELAISIFYRKEEVCNYPITGSGINWRNDMVLGITPWEKEKEYYKIVELGRDIKEQKAIISKQTKTLVSALSESSREAIVSRERLSEGIDEVSYGIEKVSEGMDGLKAAFEWSIAEVVWQLEQNRKVLKDILEVLSKPLDTQAMELRIRAETAYRNGWIEDALTDFLESENANRYDFTVHISLGHIYLFHKNDFDTALTYYDKAIKYAKPQSKYYTSYAMLHKALIHFQKGNLREAEAISSEAAMISPNFSEALYQNSKYKALLNVTENLVSQLKKLINQDKNYCLRIEKEECFDLIRSKFVQMVDELCIENYKYVNERYVLIKEYYGKILVAVSGKSISEKLDAQMRRLEVLSERNSYFDSIEARELVEACKSAIIKETDRLYKTSYQQGKITESEKKAKELSLKARAKKILFYGTGASFVIGFGSCVQKMMTLPVHNSELVFENTSIMLGAWIKLFFYGTCVAGIAAMVLFIYGKKVSPKKKSTYSEMRKIHKLKEEFPEIWKHKIGN
jgi:tetratricopeptide (TPR) repeat protein